MSCYSQCTDLKLYDYNTNTTIDIINCECSGCCYNINSFINFMYLTFYLMTMFIICSIGNGKKNQYSEHYELINAEQTPPAPAYTENV